MMTFISGMMLRAKVAAKKALTNERGDVNVVAIVVLIAVAVVLAILLKDELSALISSLVGSAQDKAETILQ